MFWTDERISLLKTLHAKDWSASEMRTYLHAKSRNAILGKLHRLGLSKPVQPKVAKPLKRPERQFSTTQPPIPPAVRKSLPLGSPEPLHVVLNDLEHHHCRWPYGEENYTFCGHQRGETSYCPYHAWLSCRS